MNHCKISPFECSRILAFEIQGNLWDFRVQKSLYDRKNNSSTQIILVEKKN